MLVVLGVKPLICGRAISPSEPDSSPAGVGKDFQVFKHVLAGGFAAALISAGIVATPEVSYAAPGARAWHGVAVCESGDNPRASTGNGFYGMYQFNRGTWHSMGYRGTANQFSRGTQTAAAHRLYAQRGWHPWPVCGKRYLR